MNWDEYFVLLSKTVAQKSKDSSTKVGCVIVGEEKEILSTGFNGICRGVKDSVPERNERPEKYYWYEHAERNAIYNAARNGIKLKNSSLYVFPLPPCCDCSRAIIQAGIKKVFVCIPKGTNIQEKWKEDFKRSKIMFEEAGVEINLLD